MVLVSDLSYLQRHVCLMHQTGLISYNRRQILLPYTSSVARCAVWLGIHLVSYYLFLLEFRFSGHQGTALQCTAPLLNSFIRHQPVLTGKHLKIITSCCCFDGDGVQMRLQCIYFLRSHAMSRDDALDRIDWLIHWFIRARSNLMPINNVSNKYWLRLVFEAYVYCGLQYSYNMFTIMTHSYWLNFKLHAPNTWQTFNWICVRQVFLFSRHL